MKKLIKTFLILIIFLGLILFFDTDSLASSGATEDLKYIGVCLDDLEENEIQALRYIIKQMKVRTQDIDIQQFQVSDERISKIVGLAINANEVFGIGNCGISSYQGIATRVSPSYTLTQEEFEDYWEKIDKKVNKFLDEVNQYDDLSELDKIIFATNFIGKYCRYRGSQAFGVWHDISGGLGDGICVCDGYAKSLSYLLAKMDIESEVVESHEMKPAHAWTLVKYEGDWYHIDMTANDTGGYGNYDYGIFMAPDEIFDGTHGIYGTYGWVTNHEASNSQFLSKAIWKSTSGHPLVYNGESWCIGDRHYKDNIYIYKMNEETCEKEVLLEVPVNDGIWGDVCLATDGEKYYFSTDLAIYSVNYDGSELKKIFDDIGEDESIYGIDFIDGVIYCSVEVPSTTGLVTARTEKILVETEIPDYTTLEVKQIENTDTIVFNANQNLKDIVISENFPVLDYYYTVEILDNSGNAKKIRNGIMGGNNTIQIKNPLGEVVKEYTSIIRGDVSGDGKVKIYDAFQILKDVLVPGTELTEIDVKIRDFDEDGSIKIYDAFQFLKQAILS